MKICTVQNDPNEFMFWCPACDTPHGIRTPPWTFNGDLEKPTIRNSVLVTDGVNVGCHSYVTDGRIEFLSDSPRLAGQTVDLPDWPY
jgi:hypothetical protein